MARPAFKRAWTRTVPEPIERSVYVVAASVALIVLFAFWRPIATPVWSVTSPALVDLLWIGFGLGWLIVLASTFLISHFELFGLTQVWRHATGSVAQPPRFRTPAFYRVVRHPLYSGFILAFFATPRMTVGHLVLAGSMLVYILIAIGHEERDLVGLFGRDYEDYRQRVGMLVPLVGRRR